MITNHLLSGMILQVPLMDSQIWRLDLRKMDRIFSYAKRFPVIPTNAAG